MVARTTPTDAHVGHRVRLRRTLIGMSQEAVGVALGVTFQQVQKYERGINRISCGRLYQLSELLGVSLMYFFEGLQAQSGRSPSAAAVAASTPDEECESEMTSRRETLELVRAYYRIDNQEARRLAFYLIRAMSGPAITVQRGGGGRIGIHPLRATNSGHPIAGCASRQGAPPTTASA